MMNSASIDLYLDSNWQYWPFSSTSSAPIASFAFSSGSRATVTGAIAFDFDFNFNSSFLATDQEVAWPSE